MKKEPGRRRNILICAACIVFGQIVFLSCSRSTSAGILPEGKAENDFWVQSRIMQMPGAAIGLKVRLVLPWSCDLEQVVKRNEEDGLPKAEASVGVDSGYGNEGWYGGKHRVLVDLEKNSSEITMLWAAVDEDDPSRVVYFEHCEWPYGTHGEVRSYSVPSNVRNGNFPVGIMGVERHSTQIINPNISPQTFWIFSTKGFRHGVRLSKIIRE